MMIIIMGALVLCTPRSTPPHPFRDCMWEAGGHKDYGGARPRYSVEIHVVSSVCFFLVCFWDVRVDDTLETPRKRAAPVDGQMCVLGL